MAVVVKINFATMRFSDTHCHVYVEQFDEDRIAALEAAKANNIHRLFLPNIDSSYNARLLELYGNMSDYVYPMMGLHPCSVKSDYLNELAKLKNELFHGKTPFVAVGEIGIDLYWDKTFFRQQQDAFKMQVEWALELDLPIVIHVRDAFEEIFDLMDQVYTPKLRGIFHCFTGGDLERDKILGYDQFMFGIGGVVTFKNSGLDKVVADIPIDRIVLETDSPYLAPHPFRGKRNEPKYLLHIAEKVAQTVGVSLEKLSEITEENVNRMFRLQSV